MNSLGIRALLLVFTFFAASSGADDRRLGTQNAMGNANYGNNQQVDAAKMERATAAALEDAAKEQDGICQS